jgi:GNAT superfamily N-acetyltransferase
MRSNPVTLLDEAQCQALESFLVERIYEFNSETTGYFDRKLLGGSILDKEGKVIAGFSGHTWGGCCELTHVWVSTKYRGQGLGNSLLRGAEAEALQRGCLQVVLLTHSFQAPGFYEANGYERKYAIEGLPVGHSDFIYVKVLSRNPVPNPAIERYAAKGQPSMHIETYHADRRLLLPLFTLADDSQFQISTYIALGEVMVAWDGNEIIGYLQIIETDDASVFEIKSMAVVELRQGEGIGRTLVEAAVLRCCECNGHRLIVSTATADIGNLRFYQRQGFRMYRIVQDAFHLAAGYAEGTLVDGIPLRDQVFLELYLPTASN